jgi:hypothetical protein
MKGRAIDLSGRPEAALFLKRNQRRLRTLPELAIGIADLETLLVQRRLCPANLLLSGIGIGSGTACAVPMVFTMQRRTGLVAAAVEVLVAVVAGTRRPLIGQAAGRLSRREILMIASLRKRRCLLAASRPVLFGLQMPLRHGVVPHGPAAAIPVTAWRQHRSVIVFCRLMEAVTRALASHGGRGLDACRHPAPASAFFHAALETEPPVLQRLLGSTRRRGRQAVVLAARLIACVFLSAARRVLS